MIVTSLILICKTKYYYDVLAPSIPIAPLSPVPICTDQSWLGADIYILLCPHGQVGGQVTYWQGIVV